MRLTSKGNRSRHAKAGADGVDGREDGRAGGKFWTGWEGSAALGRSRHGRVRMRVEKKIQGLEAGAGLAGWLDSQRAPAVSGWRQGHVARASSGEASSNGTVVPEVPGYMQVLENRPVRPDAACQLSTAGRQLGDSGPTCHAPSIPVPTFCGQWRF